MHFTHICESGVLVEDGIAAGAGRRAGWWRWADRSRGVGGCPVDVLLINLFFSDQFGDTPSIYRIDMYD